MSVGYVYDDAMTKHKDCEPHVEIPERITFIYKQLCEQGLIDKMTCVDPRPATNEELCLAHDQEYVEMMDHTFATLSEEDLMNHFMYTPENGYDSLYVNEHTLDCAKIAAGSSVELVEAIISDKINSGIAIVRPPGHHASENKPGGFSFFNNVAVAAMAAQKLGKTVAIVDWDIHYGDGTVSIVANKPGIEFFSVHRYDNGSYYPFTGHESDIDNIHNYIVPVHGDDEYYTNLFDTEIIPKLQSFSPDIILVSCGFDAAEGDPVGGFSVTPEGFANMLASMLGVTEKVALILEGGYNVKVISKCAAACVEELLGTI